jgi:hypothetical protein
MSPIRVRGPEGSRFRRHRRGQLIEFGHPGDPYDDVSTKLAGDNVSPHAHNGTLEDIRGSWVEVEFNSTNTLNVATDFNHNLYLHDTWYTVPVAGSPNVRWFVAGWQHSGALRTFYDDLRMPATSSEPGPLAANVPTWGPFLGAGNLNCWRFSGAGASVDELFFTVQLPHRYVEGTDIEPHIHWAPTDINAGGVYWQLEYTWEDPSLVFPAVGTIGSATISAGAMGAAWRHNITSLGTISPPTSGTISSMLVMRLFRDAAHASDTYGSDAALLELDIHYEVDSPGSDGIYTKSAGLGAEICPFSIMFRDGDTVAANTIQLRCHSQWLDVSDTDPLKVTLFFIEAIQ